MARRAMTTTFFVAALTLSGALATAGAVAEHPIHWMDDYADTLSKAKAENRLVMIEFYTSWCVYCGKLEKVTLGDPRVVELSKDFACARLDAEVQKVAASRYRPEGYPLILFATPTGEEIVRVNGFKEAEPFLTIMRAVREHGPKIAEHAAKLDEDPKNLEALEALGRSFLELGLPEQAIVHLNRALKLSQAASNPGPEGGTEDQIQLLVGRALREEENFKKAAKTLEGMIETNPESHELPRAYLELERVYDDWGKNNTVAQMREKGEKFFGATCARCHGASREGSETAPPLSGIEDRWTLAELATYVLDPESYRAGSARMRELDARYPALQMPPIDLPEERRRALLVWLLTSSVEDREESGEGR